MNLILMQGLEIQDGLHILYTKLVYIVNKVRHCMENSKHSLFPFVSLRSLKLTRLVFGEHQRYQRDKDAPLRQKVAYILNIPAAFYNISISGDRSWFSQRGEFYKNFTKMLLQE